MTDESQRHPSDMEALIERAHQDAHEEKMTTQSSATQGDEHAQLSDEQRERREAVLKRISDLTEDDTTTDSLKISGWIQTNGSRLVRRFGLFGIFCIVLSLLAVFWGVYVPMVDRRVSKLEQELEDIRYKSLFTTAELIKHEQISTITQNIESFGLDLEPSTYPPYEIVNHSAQTSK
ncbi:FtsL-like putative cell division protein [Porphyromonas sp. COT-290 OH3588]|uniref:FtsL-like putative cell division protein n=1 Tax=Porphyromonas sp. COT-290 OH3588 TaxID=1515617 RepID=UPI000A7D5EB8|nr:FtsL-like putative cell division protein [Porphyromonas sp. COT-290 OH3588]